MERVIYQHFPIGVKAQKSTGSKVDWKLAAKIKKEKGWVGVGMTTTDDSNLCITFFTKTFSLLRLSTKANIASLNMYYSCAQAQDHVGSEGRLLL